MKLAHKFIFYVSQRRERLKDSIASNEKSVARLEALRDVTVLSLPHAHGELKNYIRRRDDFARLPHTLKNLNVQNEKMKMELLILQELMQQCGQPGYE